jgi:prepilin-type N-terminal cleavage/methylation domain-containing protein
MAHRSNIINHFMLFIPGVAGLPYPRSGGATVTKGFTLVELIVVVAILGILIMVGIPSYNQYVNRTKNARAMSEISILSTEIAAYTSDNGGTNPDDLGKINRAAYKDPWKNEYIYNNFKDLATTPPLYDSISPLPLNQDFDIYSRGVDGASAQVGNGSTTIDDIIRSNDGAFIGLRAD